MYSVLSEDQFYGYFRSTSSTTNEIKIVTKTAVLFVEIVITVNTESNGFFFKIVILKNIHLYIDVNLDTFMTC